MTDLCTFVATCLLLTEASRRLEGFPRIGSAFTEDTAGSPVRLLKIVPPHNYRYHLELLCGTHYCVTVGDTYDIQLQELRRGTVVLACLQLLLVPSYGYRLLEDLSDRGFITDANTLYPLLRRLEKQGFLVSSWNTDDARPRKFYSTSREGEALLAALMQEWSSLSHSIDALADSWKGNSS